MNQELYILDLLGTLAFSIYGSYFAIKKHFDLLGILFCAYLTAVGGGTIREIICNNIPFYFYDMNYSYVILSGSIITILIHEFFTKIQGIVLIFDSIGLVTFAFIGASKATQLELGTFGIIFFAFLTSVGGGIIRDLVLNKTPEIMHRDFYSSIAILLGIIYAIFRNYMNNFIYANILLVFCLCIRFFVIHYKINLWKPTVKKD